MIDPKKYPRLTEILAAKRLTIDEIPDNLAEEFAAYAAQVGADLSQQTFEYDVMDKPDDIQYWLDSKLKYEGYPTDDNLIEQIRRDGKINVPVLLDLDRETTIEGRHRLWAALKYGLKVPVLMMSSK